MGKQICFYMHDDLQRVFLKYIEKNYIVYNRKFKKIDSISDDEEQYISYLFREDFGNIVMDKNNSSINILESPVIEYMKSSISDNKISCGRIWISTEYFDMDKEMNSTYVKEFEELRKWIKKSVPYQMINRGNHAIKAYVTNELIELSKKGYIFLS